MRSGRAAVLVACVLIGSAQPVLAQNFFERLFGIPRPAPQPYPGTPYPKNPLFTPEEVAKEPDQPVNP